MGQAMFPGADIHICHTASWPGGNESGPSLGVFLCDQSSPSVARDFRSPFPLSPLALRGSQYGGVPPQLILSKTVVGNNRSRDLNNMFILTAMYFFYLPFMACDSVFLLPVAT